MLPFHQLRTQRGGKGRIETQNKGQIKTFYKSRETHKYVEVYKTGTKTTRENLGGVQVNGK